MSKIRTTTFDDIILPRYEYEKLRKGEVDHIEVVGFDKSVYKYELIEIERNGRIYKLEGNN